MGLRLGRWSGGAGPGRDLQIVQNDPPLIRYIRFMVKAKNKGPKITDLGPETLAAIRKGLQDSVEGKTVYLGSFAAYVEE
jgi:hypothetical protein